MALISSGRIAAAVAAALLLFAVGSNALLNLMAWECQENSTISESLQRGINNALLEVVGRTSISGYAATSYWGNHSVVFGLTWCRGDISAAVCSACVTTAAQQIRERCPDSPESLIWLNLCFLRYGVRNFIGKAEPIAVIWGLSTSKVHALDQRVGELMGEVTAAALGGRKRFGWGEKFHAADNVTLYGMASCTRDLSDSECSKCLDEAKQSVSNYCDYPDSCYIILTSCALRFESYPFLRYQRPHLPAVAPPPSH